MARKFATVLGVVLLAVGIWGTLTGGHAHTLVIFGVNGSHNLVHLLSGALALVAAFLGEQPSQLFCLAFGTVYGLVAVCGFFNLPFAVSMLNLNDADDFLHLAISVACLVVGGTSKAPTAPSRTSVASPK